MFEEWIRELNGEDCLSSWACFGAVLHSFVDAALRV